MTRILTAVKFAKSSHWLTFYGSVLGFLSRTKPPKLRDDTVVASMKLFSWGCDGALDFVRDLCELPLQGYTPVTSDKVTLKYDGPEEAVGYKEYVCCGKRWRTDLTPQVLEIWLIDPADTATFRTIRH